LSAKTRLARRNFNVFSLSFLDIMSCGLGAVILVFLLIKHADQNTPQNLGVVQQDIESQQVKNEELRAQRDDLEKNLTSDVENLKSIQEQLKSITTDTVNAERLSSSLKDQAERTQAELEEANKQSVNAAVKVEGEGNRNYLIGLKVEGRKIVLLLDSSASMLATDIVDIIRLRNSSTTQKVKAPKWVWAKNVLQWMTARLPSRSQVRLMTFSTSTVDHSVRKSWMNVRDTQDLASALSSVQNTIPANGTNLEQAFDNIAALSPKPDALYIITDGLPTIHGDLGTFDLDNITSCYRSKKNTVTPKCRADFFTRALKKLYKKAPNITANVILLPIEGDPAAALGYWLLANQNGGMLLTPSENWP
jgi:hypothetical protein